SEVDAIDSTNLGEIARIADRLVSRNGKRAAIISTRPEISEVLYSMAFHEVFDIYTEFAGTPSRGETIPLAPHSHEASMRVILAAHRRLMQMSESNRKQFSEVVELMESDLGDSAGSRSGAGV